MSPSWTDRPWPSRSSHALSAFVLLALVTLLAVTFLRTAWVGDDAYITFRTIDNFLNGYGLRWNVAERVQSYTHPLWLFVLMPVVWLTGNPFVSALAVSAALSACVVGLVLASVRDRPWQAVFILSAMILSKAFIDYSSSGLENALSHLLLAALMLVTRAPIHTPGRAAAVGLLACLTSLTRLDLTLLAWPIGLSALRSPRRTLWAFAVAQTPLLVWELFSLVYYGVPFPNTAYAKLATGVPQSELLQQGAVYITDSLTRDPVTLFVIMAGVFAGVGYWRRGLVPSLAIGLYLVYVVRIGGDFMSGRFFSAPFVVSLCVLARVPWPAPMASRLAPVGTVLLLGLVAAPKPTILSDSSYSTPWQEMLSERGVVDERGFYFQGNSWLAASGLRTEPGGLPELREKIRRVEADNPRSFPHTTVGLAGYYTGPDRHIIDVFALCDPLLARLPTNVPWRIGHFQRDMPAGYWESVNADRNLIEDPAIASLYETIRTVTRGPLWTRERWRAIVALNTGRAGG